MKKRLELQTDSFEPPFEADVFSRDDAWYLKPFFTNLNKSVYSPMISSPEVVGALCSRASRAASDLRSIFLNEYVKPFIKEGSEYGNHLKEFIAFLHRHPAEHIFSNPRARSFYAKWLAQYGDDSIAQMAGMHVICSGISQLAIKHLEDQRIGLAPIEKSTRYVDYSKNIAGKFRYYTDPTIQEYGLEIEYREAMDGLFKTYIDLLPKLRAHIQRQFPEEKIAVVEKKAFDTLRGLLPVSTLSQVALFGNGQAFEYLVTRCLKHRLGEVRWVGERVYEELYTMTPSFLQRIKDEEGKETTQAYQEYIAGRGERMEPFLKQMGSIHTALIGTRVSLIEYDPEGEEKVITGMLYSSPNCHETWDMLLQHVRSLSSQKKQEIIAQYLAGRTERWQKVGRAFENTFVRFEITMNIGAWRDLHRHRMLTQQRQYFTISHGFDTPKDLITCGLDVPFRSAIHRAEEIFRKIEQHNSSIAQYAATLAHRVRFMQWENLREAFWEMELRSIPEGHPDYRNIEQEKFRLLAKIYPNIASHMRVNMGDYDFARRGQEEKIQAKLKSLQQRFSKLKKAPQEDAKIL